MNKQEFLNELTKGKGYTIFRSLISDEQVAEANQIINQEIVNQENKVTHFQGANRDKMHLQKRVWNLLNKGKVFSNILLNEKILDYVSVFLGDEFCLGSMAVNCLLAGGQGQEPHIDYPYWDMYKKSSFPYGMNASIPLNCQVTVMLDDFTEEKGATAILAGSQKWSRYPRKEDHKMFYDNCSRTTGKAGDVAIFYGLTWHCAMPNHHASEQRSAILLQFLPKFVKPMEDQIHGVSPAVIQAGEDKMKQLVGMKFPYPKILDEAEAKNTEGLIK